MTTLDCLNKINKLLSSKSKWIKYDMAKTITGIRVLPRSEYAYCFCLSGAIHHICNDEEELKVRKVIYKAMDSSVSIASFNDDYETAFVNIKQLLLKAIRYERENQECQS